MALSSNYRGSAGQQYTINTSQRRADTRRFSRRFRDAMRDTDNMVAIVGFLICAPAILATVLGIPFVPEVMLVVLWVFRRRFMRTDMKHAVYNFPFRVPKHARVRDGSIRESHLVRQPKGKGKAREKMEADLNKVLGQGITYLGDAKLDHLPVYATDSDMRTHQMVFGTTGSGKTEYLLGLVVNALVQNTGYLYVDGKGDPNLQANLFRLLRYFGREDDMLLISFMTCGRDFFDKQTDKVTNNINLFGKTSAGMLTELIVSLMDGEDDMWKGRAISFVSALTRPLIYLRENGHINLDSESYLDHFELNLLEEIVWDHDNRYGRGFEIAVTPLKSYLLTLPGYLQQNKKKQEGKTLEQHGYITMQLTRTFNDLSYNYGHIFKTKVGDIDFFDVVLNRRCMCVLLPALERAPDSLKMLGKLIIGNIKQMLAGCLGNKVEGFYREVIEARPTKDDVPFYLVLDEYGYYAVNGFAVAAAQSRSLGTSCTFAAQDFASLKAAGEDEAQKTWENTNVRAFGRMSGGMKSETWEMVSSLADDVTQAVYTGYERRIGEMKTSYVSQDSVAFEKQQAMNIGDFAQQQDGEFTWVLGKKESGLHGGVSIVPGMAFYTGSKFPKEMRTNDFLPIEPPEDRDMPDERARVDFFLHRLREAAVNGAPMFAFEAQSEPEPVQRIERHLCRIFATCESEPALSSNREVAATALDRAAAYAVSWTYLDDRHRSVGGMPLPLDSHSIPDVVGPPPPRPPEPPADGGPAPEDRTLADDDDTLSTPTDLLQAQQNQRVRTRLARLAQTYRLRLRPARPIADPVLLAGIDTACGVDAAAKPVQDDIAQLRAEISEATTYLPPPTPKPHPNPSAMLQVWGDMARRSAGLPTSESEQDGDRESDAEQEET